ncbi:DDE superfamily endonuclease [Metschnikowia aff. pulcherrima]|uniref:DDE superfamily endonuclease n=1 Tax=Metschnikowia aff. pulcherrima TaxID=2163413 RepID=A0A4P6XQP9_9ASCO|nr:DDE superfamily endonuclease [Metschnikowia aff. pulcherrima]
MNITSERLEKEDKEKRMQKTSKAWDSKVLCAKSEAASFSDVKDVTLVHRAQGRPGVPVGAVLILSSQEESILIDWIRARDEKGFPTRPWEVIGSAGLLVQNRPNDTSLDHAMLRINRENWPKAFLKRNRKFAIDMRRGLVYLRDVTGLVDLIKMFVNTVNAKISEHYVTKHNVYCVSESGFQMGFVAKLFGAGDEAHLETDEKNRVTILECVNANGLFLQPFVGRHTAGPNPHADSLNIELFPGDWTRDDIRLYWLERTFVHHVSSKGRQGHTILIVNWHRSKLTKKFISTCYKHQIIPFCVPENTWHHFLFLDPSGLITMKHMYKHATETIFPDPDAPEFLKYLRKFILIRLEEGSQTTVKRNFALLGFIHSGSRNSERRINRRVLTSLSNVRSWAENEIIVVSDSGDEVSEIQRVSEPDTIQARSEVPDTAADHTAPCAPEPTSAGRFSLEDSIAPVQHASAEKSIVQARCAEVRALSDETQVFATESSAVIITAEVEFATTTRGEGQPASNAVEPVVNSTRPQNSLRYERQGESYDRVILVEPTTSSEQQASPSSSLNQRRGKKRRLSKRQRDARKKSREL